MTFLIKWIRGSFVHFTTCNRLCDIRVWPKKNFITIKEFCNVTISNHDVCTIQYFDLSFFLYLMNLVSHVFELFFSAVSLCLRHLWVIECHLQWGFRNVAFFPTKNRLSKRGKKERVYIVRSIQSRKIHA